MIKDILTFEERLIVAVQALGKELSESEPSFAENIICNLFKAKEVETMISTVTNCSEVIKLLLENKDD